MALGTGDPNHYMQVGWGGLRYTRPEVGTTGRFLRLGWPLTPGSLEYLRGPTEVGESGVPLVRGPVVESLEYLRLGGPEVGKIFDIKGCNLTLKVIRGFSQKIPADLLSYDKIHS